MQLDVDMGKNDSVKKRQQLPLHQYPSLWKSLRLLPRLSNRKFQKFRLKICLHWNTQNCKLQTHGGDEDDARVVRVKQRWLQMLPLILWLQNR